MSDCTYDDAGCLVCVEEGPQAAVPARVERRAVLGWNAGANSIDTVDGDLHVVFDMPLGVIGTILGLKGGRTKQTIPSLIEHGWYFQKSGGLDLVQPIEQGVPIGSPVPGRVDGTSFEIRRANSVVTYRKDGEVVHTSTLPSLGAKVVNCCLYASGDSAPGLAEATVVLDETVDFTGSSDAVDDDPFWTIEVPDGASNLTLVVTPPIGDPSAVSMIVNYAAKPTGSWPLDTTGWSGFTYAGAAGVEPNAGPVDLTLSFESPAPGTWYVVLDPSDAGTGYRVVGTLA